MNGVSKKFLVFLLLAGALAQPFFLYADDAVMAGDAGGDVAGAEGDTLAGTSDAAADGDLVSNDDVMGEEGGDSAEAEGDEEAVEGARLDESVSGGTGGGDGADAAEVDELTGDAVEAAPSPGGDGPDGQSGETGGDGETPADPGQPKGDGATNTDAANDAQDNSSAESDAQSDANIQQSQPKSEIREANAEKVQAKKNLDNTKARLKEDGLPETSKGLDAAGKKADNDFEAEQKKYNAERERARDPETGEINEDDVGFKKAKEEYENAEKTYQEKKQKIQDGQDELNSAQEQYNKAEQDFNDAKNAEGGKKKLRNAKREAEAERRSEYSKQQTKIKEANDLTEELGDYGVDLSKGKTEGGISDTDKETYLQNKYGDDVRTKAEDNARTEATKTKRDEIEAQVKETNPNATEEDINDQVDKEMNSKEVQDEIEAKVKEKMDGFDDKSFEDQLKDAGYDEAEIEEKANAYKADSEKLDNLQDAQNEITQRQANIDSLTDEIASLGKALPTYRESAYEKAKWVGEQLMMGFAFMIPGDIVNFIKQEESLKALYDTITASQSFGGISLSIPSSLVPRYNPTGGVFIYTDGSGGYYASYGQYGSVAQSYLGSGQVTQMINFNTGAVFDSSGVVEKVIPLFPNGLVTAQSGGETPAYLQNLIEKEYGPLKGGQTIKRFAGSATKANSFLVDSSDAPAGDPGIAAQFYSKQTVNGKKVTVSYCPKCSKAGSGISPVLNNTLTTFKTPQSFNTFGITMQQMEGIGAMTYPLFHFGKLFTDPATTGGTQAGKTSLGMAILKAIQAGTDLTVASNWSAANGLAGADIEALHIGVTPKTQLVGMGLYIYQSANTPLAKFLKSRVATGMQQYINDYLVCINQNDTLIPALVPEVNPAASGVKVQWVQNPNIAYIVSLVNGATFAPNSSGKPLQSPSGQGLDYSYANTAKSAVMSQYGGSLLVKSQLGAMKFFAETLLTEGPFTLRSGVRANLVTGMEDKLLGKDESQVSTTAKNDESLVGAGQGGKQSSSDTKKAPLSISARQTLLKPGGGVYIYRIDKALEGLSGKATGKTQNTTSIPDYVVPVTVNQATGNYMMVPLGLQAAMDSGTAVPQPAKSVTALLSLVTGKVYDSTYTPMPSVITTNIRKQVSPGEPETCKVDSSPNCPNGFVVQDGGMNVPIATAFMETELNPVNRGKTSDFVTMWPFYFTLIEYDYCPFNVSNSLGVLQTSNLSNYLTTPFATVSTCASASTMTLPLYEILPETVTGIPWPASFQEYLAKQSKITKALEGKKQPKSTLGKVIDVAKLDVPADLSKDPNDLTISEIHAAWRNAYMNNPKDKWTLQVAEGPHQFTDNVSNNWSIVASPSGVMTDTYLYRVKPGYKDGYLDGLWVAAKVDTPTAKNQITARRYSDLASQLGLARTKSGAVSIVKPSQRYLFDKDGKSSAFTKLGQDFGQNPDLNALINVGNGMILIKVSKKTQSGEVFDVVMPVANTWGEAFKVDPSNIIDFKSDGKSGITETGALANARKALTSASIPTGMRNEIMILQSGNTNDRFGPYMFGPFTCFLGKTQLNNGNYIYQAYNSNDMSKAVPSDYLVALGQTSQGVAVWGGPIGMYTQYLVSLVSGIKYTRTGTEDALWSFGDGKHLILWSSIKPGKSGTLSLVDFPTEIFPILKGAPTFGSGVPVDKTLQAKIIAANKAYVEANEKKEGIYQLDYKARAMKMISEGKTKFKVPTTLTKVPRASNSQPDELYQDTNGNYYLKTNRLVTAAGYQGYYAFNVAQKGDPYLTQIPTGVYFELPKPKPVTTSSDASGSGSGSSSSTTGSGSGTDSAAAKIVKATAPPTKLSTDGGKPMNVLVGYPAKSLAAAHGISISSVTGAQSRTFPVESHALSMTNEDKDLGGGKEGIVMKKVVKEPVLRTKNDLRYYLYENIANYSATEQGVVPVSMDGKPTNKPLVTNAPSDILLQVNPLKGGAPYYISLVSGLEFEINGNPRPQSAFVYYPKNKKGDFVMYAPMTVWGEGTDMSFYIPTNNNPTGWSTAASFGFTGTTKTDITFVEYTVGEGGIVYQYTNKGATKIYNFTHADFTASSFGPDTVTISEKAYMIDVTDVKQPKVVKTWSEPSAKGETQMTQALLYAKAQGLIPTGQEIFVLSPSSPVLAPTNAILAKYNNKDAQWSLYDYTTPQDAKPLALFSLVLNSDNTPVVLPSVLHFLGTRKPGQAGQLVTAEKSQRLLDTINRVVYFKDNIPKSKTRGSIISFTWGNAFFTLDPIKHDRYNGTLSSSENAMGLGGQKHFSFVETISPLLYCADSATASANAAQGVCAEWPSKSRGAQQFPHDIPYFALRPENESGGTSTLPSEVYGFHFPRVGNKDLESFYTGLKLVPIDSNQGVLTIVRYIDVTGLKALGLTNVGSPLGSDGVSKDTFASYSARITKNVTAKFNSMLAKLQKHQEQNIKGAQAAAASQRNFDPPAGQQSRRAVMNVMPPWCQPGLACPSKPPHYSRPIKLKEWCQPGADCPATPPPSGKANYELGKLKYELGKELQEGQAEIAAQKAQALAQLKTVFGAVTNNINQLLYDPTTKYILYKVQKGDNIPFAQEGYYVSYPNAALTDGNAAGGFIFDEKGVPTGAVVPFGQMQRIQNNFVNLRVVGTKPSLKLALPKIVGINSVTIPEYKPLNYGTTAKK